MDSQSILSGYILQSELAADGRVSGKTIARYRSQPDGLPYVEWGGKIYIPIDAAREWLAGRVKRPNPRRKAA